MHLTKVSGEGKNEHRGNVRSPKLVVRRTARRLTGHIEEQNTITKMYLLKAHRCSYNISGPLTRFPPNDTHPLCCLAHPTTLPALGEVLVLSQPASS